jgi:hypothetical protein
MFLPLKYYVYILYRIRKKTQCRFRWELKLRRESAARSPRLRTRRHLDIFFLALNRKNVVGNDVRFNDLLKYAYSSLKCNYFLKASFVRSPVPKLFPWSGTYPENIFSRSIFLREANGIFLGKY